MFLEIFKWLFLPSNYTVYKGLETGVSTVDFEGLKNREKETIEAPGKIAGVSSIPVTEPPPFHVCKIYLDRCCFFCYVYYVSQQSKH